MQTPVRVLYIGEKGRHFQQIHQELVTEGGLFALTCAASPEQLEKALGEGNIDVALCDLAPFGWENYEVIQRVHALLPDLPVVIFATSITVEMSAQAVLHGAAYCLMQTPANLRRLPELLPELISTSPQQVAVMPFVAADETWDAREALQQRLRLERLVTTISNRFIDVVAENFYPAVQTTLEEIGRFVGADHCSLLLFSPDLLVERVISWKADESLPDVELSSLDFHKFQWAYQKLIKGEMLVLADVNDLPVSARTERRFWKELRLSSVMGIPLMMERNLVGFFGFTAEHESVILPEEYASLLILVGEILTAALKRKRIEEALIKSEGDFRSLFESMPVGLYRSTPEGRVLDANQALVEMLGFESLTDLLEHNAADFYLHPEDRVRQNLLLEQENVLRKFEVQMRRKNGDVIWARDVTRAVRNENGVITHYEGSLLDVTESKQAEARVRAAQARLQFLVSASPTVIFTNEALNPYKATFISDNVVDLMGYPPEEFYRNTSLWTERIHPTDRKMVDHLLKGLLKAGRVTCEYRFRVQSGEYRWLHNEWRVVLDSSGKPYEIIGSTTDVTERRQAEEMLARRDATLEAVSFAAEQFLKETDPEQSIQQVLERLGEATATSRVFLGQSQPVEDRQIMLSIRHEWALDKKDDKSRRSQPFLFSLKGNGLDLLIEALGEGKLVGGNISDYPEIARAGVVAEGVKSFVLAPVMVGGKWWGVLGFEEHTEERAWSTAERDALKVAAAIIGAAFWRKQAEEELREREHKFRSIFEFAGVGIALTDLEGRILQSNRTLQEMLGYTEAELSQLSLADITHPDDLKVEMPILEKARLSNDESFMQIEKRYHHKDGHVVWGSLTATTILDAAGRPVFGLGMVQDISERKKAEKELHETQLQLAQRLDELVKYTEEIKSLSALTNMLQLSSNPMEAFGWIAQYSSRLFPMLSGALFMIRENTLDLEVQTSWGKPAIAAAPLYRHDCWALRRGRLYRMSEPSAALACRHIGEPMPPATLCVPIAIQSQVIGLFYLQANDSAPVITEMHQQLALAVAEQIGLALANIQLSLELKELAVRDPLTGLYNRRYMQESLERELRRAERRGKTVGFIMFDLDHFRDLNARIGHPTLDSVLNELGHLIRSSVRGEDIACRYGGDEFLLILPEATLDVVEARAGELRERITTLSLRIEDGTSIAITASIGVACWPTHGKTIAEVLKVVDAAMYKSKGAGGNCVVVAD